MRRKGKPQVHHGFTISHGSHTSNSSRIMEHDGVTNDGSGNRVSESYRTLTTNITTSPSVIVLLFQKKGKHTTFDGSLTGTSAEAFRRLHLACAATNTKNHRGLSHRWQAIRGFTYTSEDQEGKKKTKREKKDGDGDEEEIGTNSRTMPL